MNRRPRTLEGEQRRRYRSAWLAGFSTACLIDVAVRLLT
jgi:hypothetical protein